MPLLFLILFLFYFLANDISPAPQVFVRHHYMTHETAMLAVHWLYLQLLREKEQAEKEQSEITEGQGCLEPVNKQKKRRGT